MKSDFKNDWVDTSRKLTGRLWRCLLSCMEVDCIQQWRFYLAALSKLLTDPCPIAQSICPPTGTVNIIWWMLTISRLSCFLCHFQGLNLYTYYFLSYVNLKMKAFTASWGEKQERTSDVVPRGPHMETGFCSKM